MENEKRKNELRGRVMCFLTGRWDVVLYVKLEGDGARFLRVAKMEGFIA
jgi:hypothetical protein